MSVTISFLGAAGTVTGSKYWIEGGGHRILVDAGLFQGPRTWRERNWEDPPVELNRCSAVLLTHAHIDHTGILPRYHKLGLGCPVYCTKPTAALAKILLPDSGRIQEEDAAYRAKRGKSRHKPPLPLYTEQDAREVLKRFKGIQFDKEIEVLPGVKARWRNMGHILGAASVELQLAGRMITFSGDVGRYGMPILEDPAPAPYGNLLLIESTYGNRSHPDTDICAELGAIVNRTAERGGIVLIPSFAVGRTQLVLHYLRELKEAQEIPDLPVIIDSPMASDATEIYRDYPNWFDAETSAIHSGGSGPFKAGTTAFITESQASRRLNSVKEPMVIISASGMLSGGRVLHHLVHRVDDARNTVVFVGYQPPGSRGAWMLAGNDTVRVFGDNHPVRAEIREISGLSAHADVNELLRWCRSGEGRPDRVAVVHGEPESAEAFGGRLKSELDWDARSADYLEHLSI